ncbi:MAG TPA: ArsA family ATPase [Thermoplasmata archaeon]
MRIIVYTGKGGVGKTSAAAATAIRAASMGHRTIAISTDAAHSLSDSLERHLSGVITPIAKRLDGLEIDVQLELETRWKEIQGYFSDLLESQGMDPITAQEMAVFPGMELASALFYIEQFHKDDTYDVVVIDTAPTADTLRLLAFPDIANWYFDRLFGLFKNLLRVARATVGRFMSTPLPSDKFLKDVENLKNRFEYVSKILLDPEITTIRLVVNPEKMVITETQRAYTYLCLYGYNVECLVVNRVIPPEIKDPFFKEKLVEQRKYMQLIDEIFSPIKTLRAELMPKEVVGRKMLDLLADQLFGKSDPTLLYAKESPMKIYEANDETVLAVKMPFPMDKKVELFTRGDELIVQLGAYKKSISLPFTMSRKKILGADLDNGWLKIRFEGEPNEGKKARRKSRSRKESRKAS